MPQRSERAEKVEPALAAWAKDAGAAVADVIVEADVPQPKATVVSGPRHRAGGSPLQIRGLTDAQQAKREARLADLRSLLHDVVGSDPTFFKYADAFATSVTPAQLAAIAASPLVKVVRRNERVGRRGARPTG